MKINYLILTTLMLFTLNSNAQVLPFGFLGSKNTPTINITVGTYTFEANTPQGPNSATNTGTGRTYTYSYSGTGSASYGPSVTQPTDGGTYTVIATVAANGNYATASSSATAFRISTNLEVGDPYGGGIVAYILVSGDPGYDANQEHGLIAATSDQSAGIRWYNGSNTTTGATGTAIGTGLSNTNSIIASQGETSTSYAAGLARAYTGGGYSDWYLPSKDELNKLFLNKTDIEGFDSALPPLPFYWSSTEVDSSNAWAQEFNSGLLSSSGLPSSSSAKNNTYNVRTVRAF